VNRWVLSWALNESTESIKRITGGRLFQHCGLAAEKAWSPKCLFILRTRRSVLSSDRSWTGRNESQCSNCAGMGPSIYDVPRPHVSARAWHPHPLWTSTCGWHEIHIALLKQLVQWPSGPKVEIQLYDWNLFKTVLLKILLLIYIAEKFPLFIPSKDEILVKKDANFLAWEEDRMTSVDYNFNFLCGRPHGAWPPSPSPHASTWAWPPSPLCCGRHKWMAPTWDRVYR